MSAPPAAAGPPDRPDPHQIGRHRRRRTQPQRAPPHPRPHANRLRPALRRRAATTHLRDRPRRHHAALRHRRPRRNPREHHPRPASRRGARGQAGQPPIREPATRPPRPPLPSPASRRPPRGRTRRHGRTTHRPSAHARGHRGRIRGRPAGAVLADICRDLGIVASNPLWRELSRAIISYGGNLAALVKDIGNRLGLADQSARGGASRGTGTVPAADGDGRHRPALTLISTIEA